MSTAKCATLLKQEFPSIDDEMKQYIEGVLDSGMDDFESSDDLYDAIGAILHEVSDEKSENDIRYEVMTHTLTDSLMNENVNAIN